MNGAARQQQTTKICKILNFGHLMNMQQERYQKKQYNHAEYFSPEQIEKNDDPVIQQAGELWNLGVILYAFYNADFPFSAPTDEEIIQSIITRNNNWIP